MTESKKKEFLDYALNDAVKFLLTAFISVLSYVFVNLDSDIKKIHNQLSDLSLKVESAIVRIESMESINDKHEMWIRSKDKEDLLFYRGKNK
jgi:hypothetical protein